MGNQLVAFAPSLIRPVEHYLTDVPEYQFDSNLGSTRFLKVCRSRKDELLYVMKVFVIHDPTLPIQTHVDRLISLKNALRSSRSPNCLPFVQAKISERSVIVIRPYIKYSLYDRMSTRPFIQWPEKLWIAFQLLCALTQVHKHGLCHGDLKLENILITPGLRVLICDFAPFKPVYLPRNNPSAIFGFFYDTAGRRCCYVAPERFRDDKSSQGVDNFLMQDDELKHFLLPTMDIFSAGCCLIELFTEGRVPFDLSQLLSFCANDYDPSQIIQQIEDPLARELVEHMIQRDPNSRSSAEEYLMRYKGKLFPEVMYTMLQSYYDILAFQPLIKPDSRMVRLWDDVRNLPDDPSLNLIFTSLVTAEVRGLRTVTAKLCALDAFQIIASQLKDESVLERIIPYVMYLLQDHASHRVRAQALSCLVNCLDVVHTIPQSDFNIFSGYIFPALEKLDKDISMRISMARNIAKIAQISLRYLEETVLRDPENYSMQQPQFVAEFNSQKETVSALLSSVLTDPDPVVKRVLVATEGSLELLCRYFGRSKAHDNILLHLTTFLNDKEDAHLRMAFFRCVPFVASFVGWHAAPLLIPLLKQGLSDVEEFVMREALLTIKSLAEINFFGRRFLLELLDETLPFVIHPNLWLRHACVGVIASIRSNLSQVDVHCHVIPRLKVYLKPSSNSMWGLSEVSILSKVREPVERQVYESCARAKDTLLLSAIEFLRNPDFRLLSHDNHDVANFVTRLRAEGLPTTLDPVILFFLQKHLVKVNNQRCLRLNVAATSFQSLTAMGTVSANRLTSMSQQSVLNHLLVLSMPPIKEINYASTGAVSGIDGTYSAVAYNNSTSPAPNSGTMNSTWSGPNFRDKPRGILVAHLHEHRGPILKICPLSTHRGLFATCTREDVRIWDAERMEGRNIANRSRCNIKLPGEHNVTNIAFSAGSNIIGVANDKDLYGFGLENMVAKCVFSLPISPKTVEVGTVVALESGSPNLFVVGTELGGLIGFDTRTASKEAFRLHSDLKLGLLSALCMDVGGNWMCTGTSKGILTCWDLRFTIPVKIVKTEQPIRRMKTSPFQNWGVFTSSRTQNEVSLWNLETGSRDLCLWASPQPPLTKTPEAPLISSLGRQPFSILGIDFVKSYNAVITGGTDMCVRWWDMVSPSDSYLLVSPDKAEQQINGTQKAGVYASRLVDGIEVIHDISSNKTAASPSPASPSVSSKGSGESSSNLSGISGTVAMGNAHHNSISDVSTVSTANQSFILTSSYDGVVKVWK